MESGPGQLMRQCYNKEPLQAASLKQQRGLEALPHVDRSARETLVESSK